MSRPGPTRRLACAAALGLSLLAATCTAGPAAATGVSLSIGPSSAWTDAYGLVHIVGYVRNNGVDVENTRVLVNLLGAGGSVLRTDTEYVQNVVMRPGDASPFDHTFAPPPGYFGFRVHDPVALAGVVQPARVLEATVTATPTTGPYVLQGTVINTGSQRVEAGKIQVIFLDAQGITRWVAGTVAFTSTNDFAINPGQTASWVIVRRTDAPTSWTHFFAPLAEDSLYTGNLQAPGSPGAGIAQVPPAQGQSRPAPILAHLPRLDPGAVAPVKPMTDLRHAVGPTGPPVGSSDPLATMSSPRRLGAPLTWTALLLPLLGAAAVLGLVFAATLAVLASLRLRATDPDPRRP